LNRHLSINFLSLVTIFVLFVGSVSAQEEQQPALQYIVQPGDTLTIIAQRFGIPMNDIVNANNILDRNKLFAGSILEIPGVDWIDGLIDAYEVPIGETFRSLQRRFFLDSKTLSRLGGLVSPIQVFASYPLLLAFNRGEDLSAGRAAVGGQSSIFEISASTGLNPWAVVAANQLSDLMITIPGDVLLLPGTIDPGPGAFPSPITLQVRGGNFIQGKTVVIELSIGGEQVQLSGDFLGYPLNFFDNGGGRYVALQGVHVMTPPRPYSLTIQGVMQNGTHFNYSQLVGVKNGGYGKESLGIEENPEGRHREEIYISNITAITTPEKMWSNIFQKPVRPGSIIKSDFGMRRSFSGSPYNYFHSGVDFGWEPGVDILASAKGIVVFVGELELRGRTTIINHGWGIYTLYAHQADVFVTVGDIVEPGQLIGHIGKTGSSSSGPHLHWEVWAGGVQVEPLDWLIEVYP